MASKFGFSYVQDVRLPPREDMRVRVRLVEIVSASGKAKSIACKQRTPFEMVLFFSSLLHT